MPAADTFTPSSYPLRADIGYLVALIGDEPDALNVTLYMADDDGDLARVECAALTVTEAVSYAAAELERVTGSSSWECDEWEAA